ncbi:hypothetical protein O181_030015 [Austropuccinia psidii MF-1]|uniref:Uncharacterized protein n=1 Tax=Austropuccinia psidii MF-1 TaxID=1389203 RepID=A0A9Q3H5S4_9BASI|nr:hypothetical protein [Austropuccinia psidii MF-1]
MEGEEPSRREGMKLRISRSFSGFLGGYPGISQGPRSRSGEESVEEEGYEENEVEDSLAGAPETSEAPNIALSTQPLISQAEPNFLKMMEKMTQFIARLTQEVSPRDNSRGPEFKTPSMKATDLFDSTQAHKWRLFIQSCQFIFHNDPENLFSDRNKALYSDLFLTGRGGKWIEPCISDISNEDPSNLLNNWSFFKTQLFTVFGNFTEVKKMNKSLIISG